MFLPEYLLYTLAQDIMDQGYSDTCRTYVEHLTCTCHPCRWWVVDGYFESYHHCKYGLIDWF